MRKVRKNVLGVVLALAMALTCLSTTAFAGVADIVPPGTNYIHTYHTSVQLSVNVYYEAEDGTRDWDMMFNSSSEFVVGNIDADAVQAELQRLKDEAASGYTDYELTIENEKEELKFDHFESADILDGQDAADDSVNRMLDVHEYQIYKISYDLIVHGARPEEPRLSEVDLGNVWTALEAGKPVPFTTEVNPNNPNCTGRMIIRDSYWICDETGDIIRDEEDAPTPVDGQTYRFVVKLMPWHGNQWDADAFRNGTAKMIYNGNQVKYQASFEDDGWVLVLTGFIDPVTVGTPAEEEPKQDEPKPEEPTTDEPKQEEPAPAEPTPEAPAEPKQDTPAASETTAPAVTAPAGGTAVKSPKTADDSAAVLSAGALLCAGAGLAVMMKKKRA